MQTEIKLTKTELRKISLEFRNIASRLLRTEYKQGISNLKRLINFIEDSNIVYKFIQEHNKYHFEYNLKERIDYLDGFCIVPDDSKSHEISYIYQLLKAYLVECKDKNKDMGYVNLAILFEKRDKFQRMTDNFNKNVMNPFISYIEEYLTGLQIDMGEDEQTKILIQVHGDNYGDNLGNTMSSTNIDQSNSSIGVGNNPGTINTGKIAGTINEVPQKNITEAAAEIQQLLKQLAQTYPTSTTKEKLILVTEATEKIEKDPILKSKVISALKIVETESLIKAIEHPLANILLLAIEEWRETE